MVSKITILAISGQGTPRAAPILICLKIIEIKKSIISTGTNRISFSTRIINNKKQMGLNNLLS